MNETAKFMSYMRWQWSQVEAARVFGNLGEHIWEKWEATGRRVDAFWCGIDKTCQKKLYNRATR